MGEAVDGAWKDPARREDKGVLRTPHSRCGPLGGWRRLYRQRAWAESYLGVYMDFKEPKGGVSKRQLRVQAGGLG